MKKFYLSALAGIMTLSSLSAQMKFNFLNQGVGTSLLSINKNGQGLSGGRYYDFATNKFVFAESTVAALAYNNDKGDYAGATWIDLDARTTQPAYKKDGVWYNIPWFPESDPATSQTTVYKNSPNGKYVVGQMSIAESQYGIFVFNTETKEMKRVIGGDYKHYAAYGVNDNGIVVGWADMPGGGTRRTPIYLDVADMVVHEIAPAPVLILNSSSAVNSSNIMVGDYNGRGFYFNINTKDFKQVNNPAGSVATNFMNLSETNVAVGYADMPDGSRKAIIYHPSMGDTPLYVTDYLTEKGVTITATDKSLGTACSISSDGKYIGGFLNGVSAAFAMGWAAYLDNATLDAASVATKAQVSIYPNPVVDKLTIKTNDKISDVEVYNVAGTKTQILKTQNNELDVRHLLPGTYIIKFNIGNKAYSEKFIKK
ncbi:T9SS type A sorting domain-containing protein [Soonwooa sp.]|uniref:T9SS type A sorting domain-containing protein n=1 Tax=Soonwooa sp. TaxID=1938592 RepID=UPI0026239ACF|nr:T9SS type A sorting domain-containing protein [Soonwooa sp.]